MSCRFTASALLAFLFLATAAWAGECPGKPDALGVSRTILVDPVRQPRTGLMEYDETLPLEDHEVLLTFDDGPIPPNTTRVLDALAAECTKATFFVVGEMAQAYPAVLRRMHNDGHTIGTHTQHHRALNRMRGGAATREITEGIASVNRVLGPGTAAPFFRFPYLDPSPANEARALKLGLAVWSTDIHANDWNHITPAQIAAIAIARIEHSKKGILMLHDIQERSALSVPLLLQELKTRGYRIVHAVPVTGAPHAAAVHASLPEAVE